MLDGVYSCNKEVLCAPYILGNHVGPVIVLLDVSCTHKGRTSMLSEKKSNCRCKPIVFVSHLEDSDSLLQLCVGIQFHNHDRILVYSLSNGKDKWNLISNSGRRDAIRYSLRLVRRGQSWPAMSIPNNRMVVQQHCN